MTKHRSSFAAVQRPDVPDGETLMALANRAGFIIAVPRTKAVLDVLVSEGKLSRHKRTSKRDDGSQVVMWRYTLPPKNAGD